MHEEKKQISMTEDSCNMTEPDGQSTQRGVTVQVGNDVKTINDIEKQQIRKNSTEIALLDGQAKQISADRLPGGNLLSKSDPFIGVCMICQMAPEIGYMQQNSM